MGWDDYSYRKERKREVRDNRDRNRKRKTEIDTEPWSPREGSEGGREGEVVELLLRENKQRVGVPQKYTATKKETELWQAFLNSC